MNDLRTKSTEDLLKEARSLQKEILDRSQHLTMIFDILHKRGRNAGAFRFANASMRNLRAAGVISRSSEGMKVASMAEELAAQEADDKRLEDLKELRKQKRAEKLKTANARRIQSLGGSTVDGH